MDFGKFQVTQVGAIGMGLTRQSEVIVLNVLIDETIHHLLLNQDDEHHLWLYLTSYKTYNVLDIMLGKTGMIELGQT